MPSEPPPRAVVPPPLPEQVRHPKPQPEAPEVSPNFFDERFDFEEPFDLLESPESTTATEADDETAEPEEKRPRKRRRRRRRPRSAEQRDAQTTETSSDDPSSEDDQQVVEDASQESVADDSETTHAPQEQRSKRRRPRRGKGRRDSGEAADTGDKDRKTRSPSASAKSNDADDSDALVEEDVDFDESDVSEAEPPARLGFRGIPRWDEVLGMMIDKNLEARSKRSAGNAHRGHGNRGKSGDKRRS